MMSHRMHFVIAALIFQVFLSVIARDFVHCQGAGDGIPYGRNAAVGKYAELNGIRMYYEIYGSGDPLVLIHGNGGSIETMAKQIPFFAHDYRVIVADSREQGKSTGDGRRITYEQMARDWATLLDSLHVDSAYVLGWSDGGILGLLLAIHHPAKVKKLAITGANLEPDSTAVNQWAIDWVRRTTKETQDSLRSGHTPDVWEHDIRMLDLLGNQPHIPREDLKTIQAPVLVMAGDRDIIREEHTVKIYQGIPRAHLCIFPGATHFIPAEDPELFNQTVFRFFRQSFRRPDSKDWFR